MDDEKIEDKGEKIDAEAPLSSAFSFSPLSSRPVPPGMDSALDISEKDREAPNPKPHPPDPTLLLAEVERVCGAGPRARIEAAHAKGEAADLPTAFERTVVDAWISGMGDGVGLGSRV